MGRQKNFSRNDVLDKAITLFWKRGFADTSLSDLEKATGVNKSGLYSEFKDKDDMFIEALKRYSDTSNVLEILNQTPMGWQNIEKFLHAKISCSGMKGCFLASTLRELSIVPPKARQLLEQNVVKVKEALMQNLVAATSKRDPEHLADLILTFSTGLNLKMSAIKSEQAQAEIKGFFDLIKS